MRSVLLGAAVSCLYYRRTILVGAHFAGYRPAFMGALAWQCRAAAHGVSVPQTCRQYETHSWTRVGALACSVAGFGRRSCRLLPRPLGTVSVHAGSCGLLLRPSAVAPWAKLGCSLPDVAKLLACRPRLMSVFCEAGMPLGRHSVKQRLGFVGVGQRTETAQVFLGPPSLEP